VELALDLQETGAEGRAGRTDFNAATGALGPAALCAANVASWSATQLITPGLLLERGNFARDVLFPDINFIPPDRYNSRRTSGGCRSASATGQTSPRRRAGGGVVIADPTWRRIGTRISTRAIPAIAAGRWRSSGVWHSRDTAQIDLSAMVRANR
jgi:hypothetical protein